MRPTSAQPTVQTRFTKLPNSMPIRQVRSSRPVPTDESCWGCAMIPMRPLTVSIAITHGPMPAGVAREKRYDGSAARMPWSPPTTGQPSGISMNESTMIRNPWNTSVRAAATNPPTKLYTTNITVIATTISFTPALAPVA